MQGFFMKRAREEAKIAAAAPLSWPDSVLEGADMQPDDDVEPAWGSTCQALVPHIVSEIKLENKPQRTRSKGPPLRGSVQDEACEARADAYGDSSGASSESWRLGPAPPGPPPKHLMAQRVSAKNAGLYSGQQNVQLSDLPCPGSFPVAVMCAPSWAWTTQVVHVRGKAKWDDIK